jgi:hypothetical protein
MLADSPETGGPRKEGAMRQELSGWRTFAGVMFYLVGGFNVVGGLAALFNDEIFAVGKDGLLVADYTAWGWCLLIVGLLQLAAGVGIFRDRGWGRILGIGLALLSAMLHIAFLVAFPAFSLITITLSVLVVYGLIVPNERTA